MKDGWENKHLGELCEFTRGLTYAKGDEVALSNNVVLRANNIDLATNLLDLSQLKFISEKVVIPDSKKVKRGSLIVCTASGSKSHLGKVAFIDDDYNYAFGGFMGMLTPRNGVLPRYLFHRMTSGDYTDFISGLSDGANINNLKFDDLARFSVPIPTLAEQQRVIGVLDEAFSGLAIAQTHAVKNLQNALALFESYLKSIFTRRSKGWAEKRLGDIADIQSGGTPLVARKEFWGGAIPWYSSGELNATHTCNPERHITSSGLAGSNAKLFPKGSLLVGMYDTAALKMSVLDRDGAFNQAIAGIKPNDRIDVEFLLHAINSIKPKLLLARRGVRQKNLSLGKIKDIVIPLPEVEEQRRLASELRSVIAETQRLETLYQQKLTALTELKKSLLHQAFTGAL